MLSLSMHLRSLAILVLALSSSVSSYKVLSTTSLDDLPNPDSDFDIHNQAGLLAPILKPRVPGTKGSLEVLQHFLDFFKNTLPQWHVELHNSSSTTPSSGGALVPFVNLIATRDPPWSTPGSVSRLALTAHYDSKISPEGFIGATDSAAPCAMIMHVARTIDAALTRKWAAMEASSDNLDDDNDQGIQIILFDGEEAFVSWTDTDSIYGSRALAEHWDSQINPGWSTYSNPLSAISLFVLLDLLGGPSPMIPSYFGTTHWAYQSMSILEQRLRFRKLMKSDHETLWLNDRDRTKFMAPYMGDDHIPWLARGVEVLHLIPSPFPSVWHKMEDDGEHLDSHAVLDWAKLVTAFTAEWLDLESYMKPGKLSQRDTLKSEL